MEWNIQSRAHHCQECGRAFVEREHLHTLLFEEGHVYRRVDACEACWRKSYSDELAFAKRHVSHWAGLYEPPPAAPPDPIQKDTAETLLRKLVQRNDPDHAGACFILAVMLERKRLLKVKGQTQLEGRRVSIYEHPKSGDIFTIPDPNLHLDQLEAVQRDVAHLLEHGLPDLPTPPAAAPPQQDAPPAAAAAAPATDQPAPSTTQEPAPTPPPAPETEGSSASASTAVSTASETSSATTTATTTPDSVPSEPANPELPPAQDTVTVKVGEVVAGAGSP